MIRVAISIREGKLLPSTVLRRFTAKSKKNQLYLAFRELGCVRRSLQQVGQWCRKHRHNDLKTQQAHLKVVLQGHYQYYGRRHNWVSIRIFYLRVERLWKKWLCRRTRGRLLSFEKFNLILKKYPLPPPRITEGRHGFQFKLNENLI